MGKRNGRPTSWAPTWRPAWADIEERDEADVEPERGEDARLLVGPKDLWIEEGGLVVRTMDMAACAFGVTRRTVCEWLSKGCPGKPGKYDVPRMILWVRRNVRSRGGGLE